MSRAFARLRISVVLALLFPAAALGASFIDPALRFRTLPTDHFVIHFHRGEEPLASRLAGIAEDTWRRFQASPGLTPPPRTHVVLVDQTEASNGFAYTIPRDTIVVTAAWPAASDFIGRGDDWLRVVFVHEFAHIVHLDRSGGWARAVRGVFGRVPLALPNLFLPTWQIEGLAIWKESSLTGDGRLYAGDFRAIEREAARLGRIDPLDRVNGGLTDWPGGLGSYAYGLGFHEYLADRYGADKIGALADATARSIPYISSRAFVGVFGKTLGALWREYRTALVAAERSRPDDQRVTRLTRHGFAVMGPRFASPSCAGCPAEIVYSARSPDDFPSLHAIAVDRSGSRRLATRYLGSTIGAGAAQLVFDQREFRRNTGTYSDLYALDRATGRVRPLTREARLVDPDLSPDGETIVCARERLGRRELVTIRLGSDLKVRTATTTTTLVSEPDTQFNAPRWSPDGRTIAVERHRLGHESEIVLVDIQTRMVRVVASDATARLVTPTWRPDGRAIVAAADFGGDTFNLYEFPLDGRTPPRQLTRTSGGATWPDISPDGNTIVFVGYTVDGFDLFTLPYPRPDDATAQPGPTPRPRETIATGITGGVDSAAPVDPAAARRYSPLSTLKPTAWTPVIETGGSQVRIGATTSGSDVLGYHAYAMSATWLVDGPTRSVGPAAATPDWEVLYAYDRWRPTLFATAKAETGFFGIDELAAGGDAPTALIRERQIESGAVYPIVHARTSHTAFASFFRSIDEYTWPTGNLSRNRTAARIGWATDSTNTYGYSISPEDGVAVGTTLELVRHALGAFDDATTLTADARYYLSLASHHVLALRSAAGFSSGQGDMRRTFVLGGSGPNLSLLDFDRDAISLLRGFGPASFAGSRVATVNVDYRWPLARPQRGIGTLPVFLHTIHAALFVDAAHAWSDRFRARDVKTSAGGELSLNVVAGYSLPLTLTFGAGWGHDGEGLVAGNRSAYLRVGRAF